MTETDSFWGMNPEPPLITSMIVACPGGDLNLSTSELIALR